TVKQSLKVAVAKARHSPLAPADSLEEGSIGRIEWIESGVTGLGMSKGSAEVGRRLGQGCANRSAGQGIQVASVGGTAQFGAAGQVAAGATESLQSPPRFGLRNAGVEGHLRIGGHSLGRSFGGSGSRWQG